MPFFGDGAAGWRFITRLKAFLSEAVCSAADHNWGRGSMNTDRRYKALNM